MSSSVDFLPVPPNPMEHWELARYEINFPMLDKINEKYPVNKKARGTDDWDSVGVTSENVDKLMAECEMKLKRETAFAIYYDRSIRVMEYDAHSKRMRARDELDLCGDAFDLRQPAWGPEWEFLKLAQTRQAEAERLLKKYKDACGINNERLSSELRLASLRQFKRGIVQKKSNAAGDEERLANLALTISDADLAKIALIKKRRTDNAK